MKRKRGEAMTDRAKEKEKGEENRSLDIEIERIHNKSSLENSQDQDWADHVAFFTDVEGNMDYFRSLVRNSRILKYVDEEETRLDFIHDGTFFVFGGDVCDKGIGSIRVVQQLNSLKDRYSERVIIILGNRDINKLRFTSELDSYEIENLDTVPGPYFVKPVQRLTPRQYLVNLILADGLLDWEIWTDFCSIETAEIVTKYNTIANRLRYILDCTMGAQGDFERRREELAILQKGSMGDITDQMVVNSYVRGLEQGGYFRKYLLSGVLGYIHKPTKSLFIHGATDESNYGYVPGSGKVERTEEWIVDLNAWLTKELLNWINQPTWVRERRNQAQAVNGDWGARGANRLIAYVAPQTEPSVIYQNMFSERNSCRYLDAATSKILLKNGIYRICVGHQPHGNSPSIMKGDVEVIAADTSYSDMLAPDNRGKAWSEIVLEPDCTVVRGVLQTGQGISYKLTRKKEGGGDQFIGLSLNTYQGEGGWWVKARIKPTEPLFIEPINYLISKVDGFKVSYDILTASQVECLIQPQNKYSILYSGSFRQNEVRVKYKGGSFELKSDCLEVGPEQIHTLSVFRKWVDSIDECFKITEMTVKNTERIGAQISFIHCSTLAQDRYGPVQGDVFLRGTTVVVMPVYVVSGDNMEYTLVLEQPRLATGSHKFWEVPAGMVLDVENALHAARRVLQEKIGIDTVCDELINMTETHFSKDIPLYLSPGMSDEETKYFLYRVHVPRHVVEEIRVSNQGTTRKVIPVDQLIQRTSDAKSWLAYGLYQRIASTTQNPSSFLVRSRERTRKQIMWENRRNKTAIFPTLSESNEQ